MGDRKIQKKNQRDNKIQKEGNRKVDTNVKRKRKQNLTKRK